MTTTWVPLDEPDFGGIARLLDDRRLNAQRGGEGLITLRAVLHWNAGVAQFGWQNHPAPTMWRGHLRALCEYEIEMCREWRRRGYQDYCLAEYLSAWQQVPGPTRVPPWWGQTPLHAEHRAALVARLPQHYGSLWPDVQPRDEGFSWPGQPTDQPESLEELSAEAGPADHTLAGAQVAAAVRL